jgi:hypothetical protein
MDACAFMGGFDSHTPLPPFENVTPLVHKLYNFIQSGHADRAAAALPRERIYPLPPSIARRMGAFQ